MYYRFSIDDCNCFLKDITENNYKSIFENPFLNMYKKLHDEFGAKFQFNLFYEDFGFTLSEMTDHYKEEWKQNSDWIQLSFHSRRNSPQNPYMYSTYKVAYKDCIDIHKEIIRFAGEECLNYHTTVHYCTGSPEALKGFRDAGIKGLVGLFPSVKYNEDFSYDDYSASYIYDKKTGFYYYANRLVINNHKLEALPEKVEEIKDLEFCEVMIHEGYFYENLEIYQPDFFEKIRYVVKAMTEQGREPIFLDNLIEKV